MALLQHISPNPLDSDNVDDNFTYLTTPLIITHVRVDVGIVQHDGMYYCIVIIETNSN